MIDIDLNLLHIHLLVIANKSGISILILCVRLCGSGNFYLNANVNAINTNKTFMQVNR